MNYKLSEIASITGSSLQGADMLVDNILFDSRNVNPAEGSLFMAVSGRNHDGHNYIEEIYSRGVRAFLVERDYDAGRFPKAGFVVAENTVDALQSLAASHRNHFKGKVVAITGSNGKTVTKEWIAQLCPPELKLFRSPRSYNSQIGVPLSILMTNGTEDVILIEAGISEPGEMDRLERIIRPDIGILTNIGQPHQENFSSAEEKLSEKLKLFRNTETIIYNPDNEQVEQAVRELYPDRILFATSRGKDNSLHDSVLTKVTENFADSASRDNASQAAALFSVLGIHADQIIDRLGYLQPIAMRLELKDGINGSRIVNDSYNSDLNSFAVALDYLGSIAGTQEKIVILSDILQSGIPDDELYCEVEKLLELHGISCLIGIGENISTNSGVFRRPSYFYNTTEDFLASAGKFDFANKAILVKGSRRYRFEQISRLLENKVHTTVLEVDLDSMISNLNHYRSMLSEGVKVMAMVKAFSYGSGSYEVAAMLQHQRVDYLAVAFADEGVLLRNKGITMPIVVLNADSDAFATMINYRLEPEIYSFLSLGRFVEEAARHGESNYPVHIKLDTGMHRLGFEEKDTDALIAMLSNNRTVEARTIFTHFAVSDEPFQDEFTRQQQAKFERMAEKIKFALPNNRILLHAANSAAISRFPAAHYDMVRLGIGLYGIGQSGDCHLKCVSTLKSRIVQIKELGEGETVGYSRNGKILKPSRIATIPIGYADGLDRRLGNGAWKFLVNGVLSPTIGNICMDTCMVDITGVDAKEGDEVIVFGENPSAEEMASVLGTIPYEIFTSVSERVKRSYIKE